MQQIKPRGTLKGYVALLRVSHFNMRRTMDVGKALGCQDFSKKLWAIHQLITATLVYMEATSTIAMCSKIQAAFGLVSRQEWALKGDGKPQGEIEKKKV